MTAEDWAPYGRGVPDADGWYPDYRTPPAHLRPAPPTASASSTVDNTEPELDDSLLAIVTNWRFVIADLLEHFHLDLYDPAVRARPWPGVRTAIFALIDTPGSRIRRALTRR